MPVLYIGCMVPKG